MLEQWYDDVVVGRGRVYRPGELPALVAEADDGERIGVATYLAEGDVVELVTLNALREGRGAGGALVDALAAHARSTGAARLRVMTTNDNTRALRLYQRHGFRLADLRPGAVDVARAQLKPSIPETGEDGIPIRDEIDLVLEL
jgi:ribosomal protein S18 acetylase RimI-like enzyme